MKKPDFFEEKVSNEHTKRVHDAVANQLKLNREAHRAFLRNWLWGAIGLGVTAAAGILLFLRTENPPAEQTLAFQDDPELYELSDLLENLDTLEALSDEKDWDV